MLEVDPLWDIPAPKVRATRLLVRVVVAAICAIAPANNLGCGFSLLMWAGMSWARRAMSVSSF